eukprot:CAMPEP_0174304104 /NCGR_PEP_ID=MMETSP0809-20121228/60580_1 /TAXON_ID=73025 ORGANISM="Eutreptiella gymnastica-like, Strain CCMP1594" /NCGR_SAMPLE_ID=MMETSP0809 /ASSEMBLY_ACC=CAM_ASM_000658 /LENGTH=201 /DNA_ID=CAMNT_0015410251 /DNA_START=1138 /DNA_END=1741 /DNA_ORIENTATION=-
MSLSTHVTKWAGAPGPADAQRPGEGARGALSGRRMCPRAAGPASRTPQPQSHTCTTGEGGWAWGWAARGGGMRGAPPPPAGGVPVLVAVLGGLRAEDRGLGEQARVLPPVEWELRRVAGVAPEPDTVLVVGRGVVAVHGGPRGAGVVGEQPPWGRRLGPLHFAPEVFAVALAVSHVHGQRLLLGSRVAAHDGGLRERPKKN